jgi:uncharacterized protein (TIGR02268 family)
MAQAPHSKPATQEPPEGLRGLFAEGIIQGTSGIAAKELALLIAQPSDAPLTLRDAYAYRSRGAVAVAVRLNNPPGATEWKAGRAILRLAGTGEELPPPQVWQAEAIGPDESIWVVVEIAVTEKQARGTYTLVLWDASGARPVTLEGVTFP